MMTKIEGQFLSSKGNSLDKGTQTNAAGMHWLEDVSAMMLRLCWFTQNYPEGEILVELFFHTGFEKNEGWLLW